MKRTLSIIVFLLYSIVSLAQELIVKSFQENAKDLSASTNQRLDNNDDPCALVKVHIASAGVQFEPNVIGDVAFKVNEYWVYLPAGTKHLKIKHPNYLTMDVVFADYGIKSLEKKMTYDLIVTMPQSAFNGNHESDSSMSIFVKGFPLKMIFVEGGQQSTGNVLKDFYVAHTEVTEKLWYAIMGNPNDLNVGNKPKSDVNWMDCYDFITKLNDITGLKFRLPTEEEWEYAATGGKQTHHYLYSGSDDIDEVAYYNKQKAPDEVALKKANELGIYDMSGSMWEWCDNTCDGKRIIYDHAKIPDEVEMVIRGGGWYSKANRCTVNSRSCQDASIRRNFIGFRLVLDKKENTAVDNTVHDDLRFNVVHQKESAVVSIGDYNMSFVNVDGGTFMMGATPEQEDFAFVDEYPAHRVLLDGFYMSKEKIKIPRSIARVLRMKEDCQHEDSQGYRDVFNYEEAIMLQRFLSEKLGVKFRLPSEEEWEYAARGGKKSRRYIYSGSNDKEADWENISMTSNELGLIGMSEGIQEWTSDVYSDYSNENSLKNNEVSKGGNIVVRGGGKYKKRRVSARFQSTPTSYNALRLVFTLN